MNGNYAVSVEMAGFKKANITAIKVDAGSNRNVDVILEVGGSTEEVTVESSTVAQVELRTGEVRNLITSEQVSELPLNGRSFVQLSLLVPGAAIANNANVRFTGLFAGVDISFSGSPTNANMWLVDGTNNVDLGSGRTIMTYPSVDSIAEFNISRNMMGADAASASGASINVVTKSGSNEFHGSAYWFHRNAALNAADFTPNRARGECIDGGGSPETCPKKQGLIYNNFGYTIGGPIVKDKAFFFWSQEWRIEGRGVPRNQLVPTALERQGDFSGVSSGGYPTPINPFTGERFENDIIPQDLRGPAGVAILNLYTMPTVPMSSDTIFNWVAAPTTPIDTRQEQIRADFTPNEQHSFMGRFTMDTWKNGAPSFQEGGLWGDDPFPGVDSDWDQPGSSLTGQWTATFGPSIINQVTFNWSGNEIMIARGSGEDLNAAATAAMPEYFPGPDDRGHMVHWGGAGLPTLWHQAPWQNELDLYSIKDDVSWVKGDHSMKMGVNFTHNAKDEDVLNNSEAFSPQYWTDGGKAVNADWAGPGAVQSTGNGTADFMLRGTHFGGGTEHSGNPRIQVRWRDYEFYFADVWRATSRFTLNYGVRWSILLNPWMAEGQFGSFQMSLYDPDAGATPTNGMIFPTDCPTCEANLEDGNPGIRGLDVNEKSLVQNHYFDIAPRLGFAFDPTGSGKWAIRGGMGMFFNREAVSIEMNLGVNPPFDKLIGYSTRAFDTLPTEEEPWGGLGIPQRGKDIIAKTPGSYQWNITVERELWKDTKVELAYVANRGHHIPTQYYLNQIPVADRRDFSLMLLCDSRNDAGDCQGDSGMAHQLYAPMYELTGENDGPLVYGRATDSWYHSFQGYLVKRFSNNLSYQFSYTFSKLISTAGGLGHIGGNTVSDIQNLNYDKGLADVDRPHIFTGNVIYRTPGLVDKNAAVQAFLGNWETSFIITANSGVPETIECCTNVTGTQQNRPDQIADSKGAQTVEEWFNTGAFRPPEFLGDLGKSARGQVRGPGISNVDFSLMKNFPNIPWFTSEGATIQFRAEFFNLFNNTIYQFIDTGYNISVDDVDESTGRYTYDQTNNNFGVVTDFREAREIQFGLKFIW
jgi:hypothetical protein